MSDMAEGAPAGEPATAPAGESIENMVTAKRWVYAGFVLMLYIFLGLIYAWSIFVPPLESEFGWSRSETSLIFTICMFCFCLGGLGAGLASRRFGLRTLLVACAVFLGVGFMLASRCSSLIELYIYYGVLIGFGVGVGYNVMITCMLKWFPDKIGLIGGLMLMGMGAGGMLLGTACSRIMQEFGWRGTFFGVGVFYLALFVVASVLVRNPPAGLRFPERASRSSRAREVGGEVNTIEMLRRRSFRLYFIWAVCTVGVGFMLIGHGAPLALELGAASSGAAAALAGLISLCNGLGRVSGGMVFDFLGRRVLMFSGTLGMIVTAGLLFLALREHSLVLLTVAFILGGGSFGFCVIAHSSVCSTFYGMRHYSLNFSVLTLYNLFASFAPFLVGMLHTWLGTYAALPVAVLIPACIGLGMIFAIKRP